MYMGGAILVKIHIGDAIHKDIGLKLIQFGFFKKFLNFNFIDFVVIG